MASPFGLISLSSLIILLALSSFLKHALERNYICISFGVMTYLPTMYAFGLTVRKKNSFNVLSPIPPVPPTNTATSPFNCPAWMFASRTSAMRTISMLAP